MNPKSSLHPRPRVSGDNHMVCSADWGDQGLARVNNVLKKKGIIKNSTSTFPVCSTSCQEVLEGPIQPPGTYPILPLLFSRTKTWMSPSL